MRAFLCRNKTGCRQFRAHRPDKRLRWGHTPPKAYAPAQINSKYKSTKNKATRPTESRRNIYVVPRKTRGRFVDVTPPRNYCKRKCAPNAKTKLSPHTKRIFELNFLAVRLAPASLSIENAPSLPLPECRLSRLAAEQKQSSHGSWSKRQAVTFLRSSARV